MSLRCRDACAGDYPAIREIARQTFPEGALLPPERFLPLLERKPALVRVLECAGPDAGRAVCGYYALWPMSRSTFLSLAEGELREKDLAERHLLGLDDPKAQVLYVMDVCAGGQARGRSGSRLTLDLLDEVRQKLSASPQLSSVAAWAYTPVGARLCERAAMQPYDRGGLEPRIWHGRREAVLAALHRRGCRAIGAELASPPVSEGDERS